MEPAQEFSSRASAEIQPLLLEQKPARHVRAHPTLHDAIEEILFSLVPYKKKTGTNQDPEVLGSSNKEKKNKNAFFVASYLQP